MKYLFALSKYCKKPLNLVLQTISLDRTVHSLKGIYEVHIVFIMAQTYIFTRSLLATIWWQKKLKFLFSIQLLVQVLMQRIHFTGFLNLIKKQ